MNPRLKRAPARGIVKLERARGWLWHATLECRHVAKLSEKSTRPVRCLACLAEAQEKAG